MFTAKELERYRLRLQALLARAAQDRAELRAEALQPIAGETSGGISNVPVHLADLGSRASEENVSMRLLENEEDLIGEINLALARIQEGTFGRCESCRRRIARERLRALPYAHLCLRCERRHERQQRTAEPSGAVPP